MALEDRLLKISAILLEYKDLYSQLDENVLKGTKVQHPWLSDLMKLSSNQKRSFDADRSFQELNCLEWKNMIKAKNELCSFNKTEFLSTDETLMGNKKKRHELTQLKSLLKNDIAQRVVDFGGGVGNLAFFLNQELNKSVHVLEQNPDLIKKGKIKLADYAQSITFEEATINSSCNISLSNFQMGIGLHTCGNFSTDIFRIAIRNKLPKVINFGCCYSKIKDHDYNLSSLSNNMISFNSRALSFATLGFQNIPHDFFDFRQKIIHYKLSFYNWLYQTHGIIEFQSMSNSRRNLYDKSIEDFFSITLDKYFPHLPKPSEESVKLFYDSAENQELLEYLWAYYAIARYFGELIEVYILCDRALFLQENGYHVEITEVFDPSISPRNKVIIAEL
jgi:hypothetical protein